MRKAMILKKITGKVFYFFILILTVLASFEKVEANFAEYNTGNRTALWRIFDYSRSSSDEIYCLYFNKVRWCESSPFKYASLFGAKKNSFFNSCNQMKGKPGVMIDKEGQAFWGYNVIRESDPDAIGAGAQILFDTCCNTGYGICSYRINAKYHNFLFTSAEDQKKQMRRDFLALDYVDCSMKETVKIGSFSGRDVFGIQQYRVTLDGNGCYPIFSYTQDSGQATIKKNGSDYYCSEGNHLEYGKCVSNERYCLGSFLPYGAAAGKQVWIESGRYDTYGRPIGGYWGGCTPTACLGSFHLHENRCVGEEISCSDPNGKGVGKKKWSNITNNFGPCSLLACGDSLTIDRSSGIDVCVPTEVTCSDESKAIRTGIKRWNRSLGAYGVCSPVSCVPGYYLDGSSCVSEIRDCESSELPYGADSGIKKIDSTQESGFSKCVATACNPEFHLSGNMCERNVSNCLASDGIGSGTKTWIKSRKSYGSCVIENCPSFYHLENGSCVSNRVNCSDPENNVTTGVREWSYVTSTYGSCKPLSCKTGYSLIDGKCTLYSVPCRVGKYGVGKMTWSDSLNSLGECSLESCSAGYKLFNNECISPKVMCDDQERNIISGYKLWIDSLSEYGNCAASVCKTGFYPTENGNCESNESYCSGSELKEGVSSAIKVWDNNKKIFGQCIAKSCDQGYRLKSTGCEKNEISCYADTGIGKGLKVWNPETNSYGSCVLTSCPESYHLEEGRCEYNKKSCTDESSNIVSGIKTWSETNGSYSGCSAVTCSSGYSVKYVQNGENTCETKIGFFYESQEFIFKPNDSVNITPNVRGVISSCSVDNKLPLGLSLDKTNCRIYGSPTQGSKKTSYVVSAVGIGGSAQRIISIEVLFPPKISSVGGSSFEFVKNSSISPVYFINEGGAISSCRVDNALPSGVIINGSDCSISGTPSAELAASDFTVIAEGPGGVSEQKVTISIISQQSFDNKNSKTVSSNQSSGSPIFKNEQYSSIVFSYKNGSSPTFPASGSVFNISVYKDPDCSFRADGVSGDYINPTNFSYIAPTTFKPTSTSVKMTFLKEGPIFIKANSESGDFTGACSSYQVNTKDSLIKFEKIGLDISKFDPNLATGNTTVNVSWLNLENKLSTSATAAINLFKGTQLQCSETASVPNQAGTGSVISIPKDAAFLYSVPASAPFTGIKSYSFQKATADYCVFARATSSTDSSGNCPSSSWAKSGNSCFISNKIQLPSSQVTKVTCNFDEHINPGTNTCEKNILPCSIENGAGYKTWLGATFSACRVSSCFSGFHVSNGSCEGNVLPCQIQNGTGLKYWSGTEFSSCRPTSCEQNYTANLLEGTCDEDVCTPADIPNSLAVIGTKASGCLASLCAEGYSNINGSCESRGCSTADIPNSVSVSGTLASGCVATSCSENFLLDSGSCSAIECTTSDIPNSLAVIGTKASGCFVQSCIQGFHVSNNGCASSSRSCFVENGLGSQAWTGNSWGSCSVSSCNSGFYKDASDKCMAIEYEFFISGNKLVRTDGSESGTIVLASGNSKSEKMIDIGNGIKLFSLQTINYGSEIWRTDGTPDGTYLVKDISIGTGSGASFFDNGVKFGSIFIFPGLTQSAGKELWRTDGTYSGTYQIKDIYLGTNSGVEELSSVVLNGSLIFRAKTQSSGVELWKTDGTESGTSMIKDLNPGSGDGVTSLRVSPITESGIIFLGTNGGGINSWQPYITDGTTAGTRPLMSQQIDSMRFPYFFREKIDGKVVFSSGSSSQYNIFATDGTESGTALISGGFSELQIGSGKVLNQKLVFVGARSDSGRELWKTDGTESGTSIIKDATPGNEASFIEIDGAVETEISGEQNIIYKYSNLSGGSVWITNGEYHKTARLGPMEGGQVTFSKMKDFINIFTYGSSFFEWIVGRINLTTMSKEDVIFDSLYPGSSYTYNYETESYNYEMDWYETEYHSASVSPGYYISSSSVLSAKNGSIFALAAIYGKNMYYFNGEQIGSPFLMEINGNSVRKLITPHDMDFSNEVRFFDVNGIVLVSYGSKLYKIYNGELFLLKTIQ